MRIHWLTTLAVMSAIATAATPSTGPTTAEVFTKLKGLVGQWNGKFSDGRPHSVTFALTAGGTVLVETWSLAPGRESMTLYHLDGESLMATHYCPQGNQPRPRFVKINDSNKFIFTFKDGTNLQEIDRSHQHSFWIKLTNNNTFLRSETYIENGSNSSESSQAASEDIIIYTRKK